ncbi:hypothetical protein MINT15_35490 [Saccharomonospora viridis]|uniref:Uncharacterized protein n=1 Tax=Saccharomonospora viridis TaxID=1852 RepID=A0A837D6S3_9PSEU|nr:hypothetical protein MINT15_35490 [Saccharomonospora viridis]
MDRNLAHFDRVWHVRIPFRTDRIGSNVSRRSSRSRTDTCRGRSVGGTAGTAAACRFLSW